MGLPGQGLFGHFLPVGAFRSRVAIVDTWLAYYRINCLISYHLCLEMKQPFRINVAIMCEGGVHLKRKVFFFNFSIYNINQ